MTTYQQAIADRFDEFGWELFPCDDVDAWWADDTWRLRSVWVPRGREVYLTFLVDPQADIHHRKPGESVWAVKASAARPTQWQQEGSEYVLDFGSGWKDRLPELFSNLERLRHEHAV